MREIEYFYSAHSAFAYLGSQAFMDIAKANGRRILHKPYDLRRGVVGVGSAEMRGRPRHHRDYFFGREMVRWAEERELPLLAWPTHHLNDIALANCTLIAAIHLDTDVSVLAHALLSAHWVDDANLADPDTLVQLAESVGLNGNELVAAANTEAVRAHYEANTAEAIARSVFGSPTYFVDGDMFYGQDRLPMVERALRTPYRGEWPLSRP